MNVSGVLYSERSGILRFLPAGWDNFDHSDCFHSEILNRIVVIAKSNFGELMWKSGLELGMGKEYRAEQSNRQL